MLNNNDPLVTKKKITALFVFKKIRKFSEKNYANGLRLFFYLLSWRDLFPHSMLLQPCHWPLTSDCGPMETTWTKRTRSPGVISPTRSRLTTATGTPASPTTWQGIRTACSSSTPSTTTSGETSRVPSAIPSSAK